jgi:predicted nuclease of predicted toxin-antitoxin system
MRVLFDECVPTALRMLFADHKVLTVTEQGWSGVKNGKLLKLAAENFDVFITVDKNLSFQQNPADLPITVIVIHSRSNKMKYLSPLVPAVLSLLSQKLPKSVFDIGV